MNRVRQRLRIIELPELLMDSLPRLKSAFADALAIGSDIDVETLTYGSIAEWDSVAHVQLINAIEKEFDVMLDTDEVLSMSSFARAKEILSLHGIEFVG